MCCFASLGSFSIFTLIDRIIAVDIWESMKGEHQDKVRLTIRDLESGDTERAERRMNDGDGGLAKHATIMLPPRNRLGKCKNSRKRNRMDTENVS